MSSATSKPTSPALAAGSNFHNAVAPMRKGTTEKKEVNGPAAKVGSDGIIRPPKREAPPPSRRRPMFVTIGGVVCRPHEAVAYDLCR